MADCSDSPCCSSSFRMPSHIGSFSFNLSSILKVSRKEADSRAYSQMQHAKDSCGGNPRRKPLKSQLCGSSTHRSGGIGFDFVFMFRRPIPTKRRAGRKKAHPAPRWLSPASAYVVSASIVRIHDFQCFFPYSAFAFQYISNFR